MSEVKFKAFLRSDLSGLHWEKAPKPQWRHSLPVGSIARTVTDDEDLMVLLIGHAAPNGGYNDEYTYRLIEYVRMEEWLPAFMAFDGTNR